jgi:secondary thiamine-phosphate synthase enzyme
MAELRQALSRLNVETPGRGLVEITRPVTEWLSHLAIEDGLLTLYCRHTSASLLIQENADPDVCRDLEGFFARIAPEDRSLYAHNAEGPDDMPAHIRAALTQTQLSIPLQAGQLLLGTWQGVYLFEHRRAPHKREIVLHLIGE